MDATDKDSRDKKWNEGVYDATANKNKNKWVINCQNETNEIYNNWQYNKSETK